jgi:hypothetical protein
MTSKTPLKMSTKARITTMAIHKYLDVNHDEQAKLHILEVEGEYNALEVTRMDLLQENNSAMIITYSTDDDFSSIDSDDLSHYYYLSFARSQRPRQ